MAEKWVKSQVKNDVTFSAVEGVLRKFRATRNLRRAEIHCSPFARFAILARK
jgi:hypothetical protein